MLPNKPKSLDIRAESLVLWKGGPELPRLVGKDEDGVDWLIQWCANGQYSHWYICPINKQGEGYFIYSYLSPNPYPPDEQLILQIRESEKKYAIYR